jgi:hypothetical protein
MTARRLLVLFLLAPIVSGFLCSPRRTAKCTPQSKQVFSELPTMIISQTRLSMSNLTFQETDSADSGPLAKFQNTWDSFAGSSAYRTVLFTGALLSSQKFRDLLGLSGCLAIFAGFWAVYTYEASFNYLVDVVTPKRQAAIRSVRQARTDQLSSSSSTNEDIDFLLSQYEAALREELETRVIIPGLWVIEMDPEQEDRGAAPQLLGLEITDKYTLEPVEKDWK